MNFPYHSAPLVAIRKAGVLGLDSDFDSPILLKSNIEFNQVCSDELNKSIGKWNSKWCSKSKDETNQEGEQGKQKN